MLIFLSSHFSRFLQPCLFCLDFIQECLVRRQRTTVRSWLGLGYFLVSDRDKRAVQDPEMAFGPFRLDCGNQQLWWGEQRLALQPKPLAVLQYLAQNAGRLVTTAVCTCMNRLNGL